MRSLLFSAIASLALFSSCQKNSGDNSSSSTTTVAQNIQNATTGNWRVSSFTEPGENKTSDFSGYSFTFNSDGTVTATNGSVTKTGSWAVTSSKFNINLGPKDNTNKPLGELTDDWRIIIISDSQIQLKNDNTTSQEFLTFSKN